MSHWRRVSFWVVFAVLLLPSAVVFAIPGAFFIDEGTFERWGAVIIPLQAFVTFGVAYVLAKRLWPRRVQERPGFPVVQRGLTDRKTEHGEG